MKHISEIWRLTVLLGVFSLLCSCTAESYREITGYAQGGTYHVIYKSTTHGTQAQNKECKLLKDGIDSILCVIDTALSGYNGRSLVSRINRGETIEADGSPEFDMLCKMTEYADSIRIATGGVVDCRAAAIFDLWGFGFKEGIFPDENQVRTAMEDRSKLNFNAIAQGYSADVVAGFLIKKGISHMLVDIGGEFFCKGLNPKGKPWKIGIDAPIDGNNSPGANMAGTFSLAGEQGYGVVTSGNYRKFRIVNGEKYSHTIDPRTGQPVSHKLLSATIIAPSSALADALATYCMVIGPAEAEKFIEGRDDLEACLICADTVWTSSGLNVNR